MLALVFLTTTSLTHAQTTPEINYQGKLLDSTGSTVADGDYDITFALYTTDSGGTPIWEEVRSGATQVTVSSGLFSVMLGEVEPLTSVDFNQTLYLGVTIDPGSGESEMNPRKVLGTVPAAFEAQNAQTLDHLNASQFVRTDAPSTIASTTADTLLSINQTGSGDILSLLTSGSNVLTVTNTGNLGLGLSSPSTRLHVRGGDVQFDDTSDTAQFFFDEATGRLGLGTTTPTSRLTVSGTTDIAGLLNVTGSGTSTISDNLHVLGDFRVGESSVFISSTGITTPELTLDGALRDSGGSAGTDGYLLQTTGSGTQWVATSTLGFADSLTFGSEYQLPFMNAGGDDFQYSSDLTFDGSTLTVGGDILPETTLTHNLGTSSSRFADVWAETLNIGTSTWSIFNNESGALSFSNAAQQAGMQALTILSNGRIGIGTTTPSSQLSVAGDARITDSLWVGTSDTAPLFNVAADGFLSMGTASRLIAGNRPVYASHFSKTVTTPTTTRSYFHFNDSIYAPETVGDQRLWGTFNRLSIPSSVDVEINGQLHAHEAAVISDSSAYIDSFTSMLAWADHSGSGNIGSMTGFFAGTGLYTNTLVNTVSGINIGHYPGGDGLDATVTNRYGLRIFAFEGTATNDFGIWQEGAAQKNYFAGNIGIGLTDPTDSLHVSGNIRGTDELYLSGLPAAASGNIQLCLRTSDWRTYQGASATSCNPSSEQYKNTILSATNSIDILRELRPVTFYFNDDNSPIQHIGFIAEEVAKIDTRLVQFNNEGNPSSLKLDNFIGLLVASLQDIDQDIIDARMITDGQQAVFDALLGIGTTTATSTEGMLGEAETGSVWHKLVELVSGFRDGVLSLFGIQTEYLCVGDVCVDEDEFRSVFGEGVGTSALEQGADDGTESSTTQSSNEAEEPDSAPATTTDETVDDDTATTTSDPTTGTTTPAESEADSDTTTEADETEDPSSTDTTEEPVDEQTSTSSESTPETDTESDAETDSETPSDNEDATEEDDTTSEQPDEPAGQEEESGADDITDTEPEETENPAEEQPETDSGTTTDETDV